MRRVEVAVGMSQAVCNRSRLLKFVDDLSARLGTAALSSPLANLLLHSQIVSRAEQNALLPQSVQIANLFRELC